MVPAHPSIIPAMRFSEKLAEPPVQVLDKRVVTPKLLFSSNRTPPRNPALRWNIGISGFLFKMTKAPLGNTCFTMGFTCFDTVRAGATKRGGRAPAFLKDTFILVAPDNMLANSLAAVFSSASGRRDASFSLIIRVTLALSLRRYFRATSKISFGVKV